MDDMTIKMPWSPLRDFGMTCYDVAEIPSSRSASAPRVWHVVFEAKYNRVMKDERYSEFFEADLPVHARKKELRRLLGIGTKLLSAKMKGRITSPGALEILRGTPTDDLLSGLDPLRKLPAYVLTLAYPAEQVLSLTSDEVTQALRVLSSAHRHVSWDVLLMLLNEDIDEGLTAALLA